MTESTPIPVNRVLAFVLGFMGFLAFVGLSIGVVMHFRNAGTGYEDARSKSRQDWHAAAKAEQAVVETSTWKDKSSGLASPSASEFLPIAAKALVEPGQKPKAMEGDTFIVPGTPTFDAFSARQAATPAPVPAPPPTPAPSTEPVPAPQN